MLFSVRTNIIVMNLLIPIVLESVNVSTMMMFPVVVVDFVVLAIHGVIMISNLFVIVIPPDYMIT